MRSRKRVGHQLDLSWTDTMHWTDLPATARAEAQGLLGDLLNAVAVAGDEPAAEDGDDGE